MRIHHLHTRISPSKTPIQSTLTTLTPELKTLVNKTVHIGNLPLHTTEIDLKAFFEKCGSIVRSSIASNDRKDDIISKFAFIEFEHEESVRNAISMSGIRFGGRELKIDLSKAPILNGQKLKTPPVPQFTPRYQPFIVQPQMMYYYPYFIPQNVGEKRSRFENDDSNKKKKF